MLSTVESSANVATLPAQPVAAELNAASANEERALLEGLLVDSDDAWREFNTRYGRLIYRCITRVTSRFSRLGVDDVREIQSMLYVQLLANDKHRLRTFEPGRGNKLGSWVGMLAVHTAYDFLRVVRREPKRAAVTEAERLVTELPDPAEVCAMRERARIVSALLEQFTQKDREFITLYYGEGLEPEQIAERMSISVKTVYSKKHKIRSRLEALLAMHSLPA